MRFVRVAGEGDAAGADNRKGGMSDKFEICYRRRNGEGTQVYNTVWTPSEAAANFRWCSNQIKDATMIWILKNGGECSLVKMTPSTHVSDMIRAAREGRDG